MNKTTFVVIPVFNEEETIAEVASSIIKKGYTVVLVNDGSTDSSAKKMKQLPGFYLEHALNLGQGAALQTGISFCAKKKMQNILSPLMQTDSTR